jgi:hypothetical protein
VNGGGNSFYTLRARCTVSRGNDVNRLRFEPTLNPLLDSRRFRLAKREKKIAAQKWKFFRRNHTDTVCVWSSRCVEMCLCIFFTHRDQCFITYTRWNSNFSLLILTRKWWASSQSRRRLRMILRNFFAPTQSINLRDHDHVRSKLWVVNIYVTKEL